MLRFEKREKKPVFRPQHHRAVGVGLTKPDLMRGWGSRLMGGLSSWRVWSYLLAGELAQLPR